MDMGMDMGMGMARTKKTIELGGKNYSTLTKS